MSVPHVHYVYGQNGAENLSESCVNIMTAIQQVDNLLLALNVSVEQVQEQWAQWFSSFIGGDGDNSGALPATDPFVIPAGQPGSPSDFSISELMTWADQISDPQQKSSYLQTVAQYSATRNTCNNQMQSFYGNINNGINQTSSNTEQVLQIDQMIMQNLNNLMQAPFGG